MLCHVQGTHSFAVQHPQLCFVEFWCTNKEVNILVNEEARLARQTKLSAHEAAWKASWQAFGGYWEKI
ncbi:hypothetical protein GLYMA_07G228800v4 [Glycine max]|nr:hypothetical protein GLYMA_07G228800v4 [Glycine max]KAG5038756.1 hypothetical protein JHK86_019596 [Glycine max]KAH1088187.1 hypothetical protein GYH30_019296 [Glycine max]